MGKWVIAGACLVGISFIAEAAAAGNCNGGTQTGTLVRDVFFLKQDSGLAANDLHFKLWQKECAIKLNGYDIDVDKFTTLNCVGGLQPADHDCADDVAGKHAVDVDATVGNVIVGDQARVDVDFWLTSGNAIRMADVRWTLNDVPVDPNPTVPDFGWSVGAGLHLGGGLYRHRITFWNDSDVDIHILGFKYVASASQILDIPLISFPGPGQDLLVGANGSVDVNVQAVGSGEGTFLYFTFKVDLDGIAGGEELTNYAEHLVWDETRVPTLSQWGLILLSLVIIAAGAVVLIRRRRASA